MSLLHSIMELINQPAVYPQQTMYSAVLPDEETHQVLLDILSGCGVYPPMDWDAHITVVYSRRCEHVDPDRCIYTLPISCALGKFTTFEIPQDDGSVRELVVLLIDSPKLQQVHDDILYIINGTHDFESFNPHVTVGWLDEFDCTLDQLNDALDEAGHPSLIWGNGYQEEIEE